MPYRNCGLEPQSTMFSVVITLKLTTKIADASFIPACHYKMQNQKFIEIENALKNQSETKNIKTPSLVGANEWQK
ncbi:MAG: hypothetical protein LBV16_01545 [Elusimicrobiota bacterium]|jgi:hypothetical protein|nr:hypothetical protein [Elusimicrobiota bacterium]